MLTVTFLASLFAFTLGHDHRLKDENGDYIGRGCGTEEYMEEQLAANPEWAQSLDDFEKKWEKTQRDIINGKSEPKPMIFNIPLIYHILYNTNSGNIADTAIASQTQTLIDDFAATNSDYTTGTPVEFRSVRSGDTEIRYLTSSVLRVPTSTSSFGSNNAIKYSSQGGSNVVNPESNLNFWVGTLSGGLLGYAQFPGGNPATDGIVCGTGTLAPSVGNPPYNLGRTGTHEIGHWLNLRHIWGDNSGCTNTESISDFVLDTPPSSSSNFGCPSGVKRCSANPYSQDMYMNYMDYVEDSCMVMFTQLQNERAYASIDQYRGGFGSSRTADREYINWLFFTRFEQEPDDEDKCIGSHFELFYDNNMNEGSDSNVFIYGCIEKTDKMSVSHITDIKFITDVDECEDGYFRASQDLNEGNDGSIYLCYNKVDSNEENENNAVLDITFVTDDNELDENEWIINKEINVNPNGVKLNFAVKSGEYFTPTSAKGLDLLERLTQK